MSRFLLLLLLAIAAKPVHAQMVRRNKVLLFGFVTRNGREACLVKDSGNHYIVYRYGTAGRIEWEYPSRERESWKKFTYSFYLRGGGARNEGMDLDQVTFVNNGIRYVLYNSYYAVTGKTNVGIKVIDSKRGRQTDIRALPGRWKGTLADFRTNGLLAISDELYE
ncbi:hypothetical protein [Flaviaesturariibacter terrae]